MSKVTVEEVTQRLHTLSPNQLSVVHDFLVTLVGRPRKPDEKVQPLEERPVTRIEELQFDFWPTDESVDDFLQARELWRTQDIALEVEIPRV